MSSLQGFRIRHRVWMSQLQQLTSQDTKITSPDKTSRCTKTVCIWPMEAPRTEWCLAPYLSGAVCDMARRMDINPHRPTQTRRLRTESALDDIPRAVLRYDEHSKQRKLSAQTWTLSVREMSLRPRKNTRRYTSRHGLSQFRKIPLKWMQRRFDGA